MLCTYIQDMLCTNATLCYVVAFLYGYTASQHMSHTNRRSPRLRGGGRGLLVRETCQHGLLLPRGDPRARRPRQRALRLRAPPRHGILGTGAPRSCIASQFVGGARRGQQVCWRRLRTHSCCQTGGLVGAGASSKSFRWIGQWYTIRAAFDCAGHNAAMAAFGVLGFGRGHLHRARLGRG